MSCLDCGRRCQGRRCRDCERDRRGEDRIRTTFNEHDHDRKQPDEDTEESREAFLNGDCHRCDICGTNFQTLTELSNHDCTLTDGGDVDGAAYVLECVRDRTSPEPDGVQNNRSNIWTGRGRMRADGSKTDSPLARDDVDSVIAQLIADHKVFEWHGLLAPATPEHLQAIIKNEQQSSLPRKRLIGKVNRWRQSLDTDTEQEQELVTDGGREVDHDPQVQDPRGSRADVGQGRDDLGGPVGCPFCGETMSPPTIPDHIRTSHNPDLATDGGTSIESFETLSCGDEIEYVGSDELPDGYAAPREGQQPYQFQHVSVGGTLGCLTKFNGKRRLAPDHPANDPAMWRLVTDGGYETSCPECGGTNPREHAAGSLAPDACRCGHFQRGQQAAVVVGGPSLEAYHAWADEDGGRR